MRILICEPRWDSGAVAADFTACSCCRPQAVLSTQNGIRGDSGLGCEAVTEKGFHVISAVTCGWDNHLRTVVLKS